MGFSEEIMFWYASNKRSLPWRNNRDPYKIWLSEVMLQQTRVAQGLPYYKKFLQYFPTVQELAAAPEKKVLKLWQGLGYYSRARNLHATARKVSTEMNGHFPGTYEGLLRLKGIGDYTASAIASICFDQPEPVVDGNVYRVLARYYGVKVPVNTGHGKRYFKELARDIMDCENPGEYNQAIMEFGAIQCLPSGPDCPACPLSAGCLAIQKHMVKELPVKNKKGGARKRYFNYLVPLDQENKTQLRRREDKGIWQHLYEFPLMETEGRVSEEEMMGLLPDRYTKKGKAHLQYFNEEEIVHKLSHQHLYTRFWILRTEEQLENGIPLKELETYPVPVLIAEFIKTLKNSYF